MHLHHILPKKAPYLSELHDKRNEPPWLVSLTVEGHACQHDILFKVFGWTGDKVARDALLGRIDKEEAISQARKDWIDRNPGHHSNAGKLGGKAPASDKCREVSAETARKTGKLPWWNNGKINKRSKERPGLDFVPGRFDFKKSPDKKSQCPHCGVWMAGCNLSRHIRSKH